MRRLLTITAFLCTTASAAAQIAPSAPSPLVPPRVANSTSSLQYGPNLRASPITGRYFAEIYQQVRQYGQCVVNVSPDRARTAIDSAPNTLDERVKLDMLRTSSAACLPYGYRPPSVFLRAGIAEALYKEHRARRVALRTDVAGLIAQESERDRSRFADDRQFVHATLCVSARAPAAVDALLRSTPGSDAERTALSAVARDAGSCLGDTSYLPGDGGPAFLRAYLAEAAYRVAEG